MCVCVHAHNKKSKKRKKLNRNVKTVTKEKEKGFKTKRKTWLRKNFGIHSHIHAQTYNIQVKFVGKKKSKKKFNSNELLQTGAQRNESKNSRARSHFSLFNFSAFTDNCTAVEHTRLVGREAGNQTDKQ